jgi:hypothetical protein
MTLRHDDGYERYGTPMPLGDTVAAVPQTTPSEAPGQFAVTMIGQYIDNTNTPQRIAIVAGDPTPLNNPPNNTAVDITMYRQNPATGVWGDGAGGVGTEMTPDAAIPLPGGPGVPNGNREALWDHCVFPFGAPVRNDGGGPLTIAGPVMVMCNADYNGPVDNVLVTPTDAGGPGAAGYDELCWLAPGPDFKAASCESFNGRVHFLNTSENGTAEPQRHRWSGVGTASPEITVVGSGYLDLAEFQRGGKRIESMQDKLVLYFGDGVAFQVPTYLYTDAYRPQIVSRTRGLLGGQGLCALNPHLHFGIFNDGWWTLDSSGRWSKLGRIILEETRGKAHELIKWEDTFYEDLDFDQTQRICCAYDRYRELVRIAYPSKTTESENYTILNYHMKTDTCWRDEYTTPTTCWGVLDLQQTTALVWDSATGTWQAQTVTWDSQAAQYQEDVLCHGNGPTVQSAWDNTINQVDPPAGVDGDWTPGYTTDGGLIFSRNPNIFTYDDRRPNLQYTTHEINVNENPLLSQSFHRFGVEYIRTDTTNALAVQVHTDSGATTQAQFLDMSEGVLGDVHTTYAHFQLHGNNHGFSLYTTAPFVVRSLVPEVMLYDQDAREGQV